MGEYVLKAVRAADGGARLLLYVESDGHGAGSAKKEVLSVFSARLHGIPAIGPLSEEKLSFYREEHLISEAAGAAFRILAASFCSRRGLVEKLLHRGVDRTHAEIAADIVTAEGFLREEEGALRSMEKDVLKYWGNRRILMDLTAKGYSNEALATVEEALEKEDTTARCVRLLRRRRVKVPPPDSPEERKLLGMLYRYGYETDEMREALQKIREAEE